MKELYIANNFTLSSHDYSVSIIYDWEVYSIELDKYLWVKCYDWKLKYYNKFRLYKIVIDILKDFIWDEKLLKDIKIYNINYLWEKLEYLQNTNYFIQNHHYLHACSAYYPSPFDESAVLIIDDCWAAWEDNCESQTMWYWNWISLEKIYTNIWNSEAEVSAIWRAYTKYSEFIILEEWSIMWLSSYGDRNIFYDIKIFTIDWDTIKFDENIDLQKLYDINEQDLIDKEKDITKSKFANIAAHLQKQVEEAIVYLANILYEKTKCKNLCLAWWVALNILANTKILEQTPFENIFVQPATNDWWISLWWTYYAYHILWENTTRIRLNSPWLWKSYSFDEIKNSLKQYSDFLEYSELKDIEKQTAKLINTWNIIWWFQWKNEFWPRALWFRSILASPKSIEIRDKVNHIKNRQVWRPLAPVILEEKINDYFSLDIKSPYMTFSSEVLKDKQKEIEWVVHIDKTARFQSVNSSQNPKYYKLLKEYYKISNTPILINTSFNVSWQTIVYDIKDAIETFLSTNLDYLIIENFLISKKQIYKQFSFSPRDSFIQDINKKDKEIYLKNLNYLKKLFFKNDNVEFCYWDNEDEYSYTTSKFCFKLEDNSKLIIEKINYIESWYKIVKQILIKVEASNYHLTDKQRDILEKIAEILEIYYDKIKILFWILD